MINVFSFVKLNQPQLCEWTSVPHIRKQNDLMFENFDTDLTEGYICLHDLHYRKTFTNFEMAAPPIGKWSIRFPMEEQRANHLGRPLFRTKNKSKRGYIIFEDVQDTIVGKLSNNHVVIEPFKGNIWKHGAYLSSYGKRILGPQ